MSKELIKELTNFEEVELIYTNTKQKEDKTIISYTVVCDVDSITKDIYLLKRIVAVMEVIKTLLSNQNILVNYNITTSMTLEEAILSNNERVIKKLYKAEILYEKNDYFENIVAPNNSKRK